MKQSYQVWLKQLGTPSELVGTYNSQAEADAVLAVNAALNRIFG